MVKQVNKAEGSRSVNVQEQGEVNHHSQRQQQGLHRHADPDEHNHSQHGQQAAVQVVLVVCFLTERCMNRLDLNIHIC